MFAPRDSKDKPGPRSCTTTCKIYGLVISCRSPTSSFAPCLPSSTPFCTLAESSMWGLLALPPTPGPHSNYGKQLPLDKGRSISFVIVTASLDPVLLVWQQPAAARS